MSFIPTDTKYRKKPVIVDAVQFSESNQEVTNKIFSLGIGDKLSSVISHLDGSLTFTVETLEGRMTGHKGDWIVKGVQGEFYIVKDDIFKETYEKVE